MKHRNMLQLESLPVADQYCKWVTEQLCGLEDAQSVAEPSEHAMDIVNAPLEVIDIMLRRDVDYPAVRVS